MIKKIVRICVFTALLASLTGCATGQTKKIVVGMLAGAVVGAVVGHEFVHHGRNREYKTRNTFITSAAFAFAVGGALWWHYDQMQGQMVEASGKYARYRLCNPDENPELAKQLGYRDADAYPTRIEQIGKHAISLDDNTKWTFPVFRKRFLHPERGENSLLSSRYIWEIMKPGSFVTRTQNPEFFFEAQEGKDK